MRLLANENFPGPAVVALRDAGHDVCWVRTEMPGAKDSEILLRAQQEQRIVVTFDKDFGELAFRSGLPAECGIILFRIAIPSPDVVARRSIEVLASRTDWTGQFAVIEELRVRFRALPTING